MDVEFVCGGKVVGIAEITIDSGAEESVCPGSFGNMFNVKAVMDEEKMRLVNAGGGRIEHVGQRDVWFHAKTTGF